MQTNKHGWLTAGGAVISKVFGFALVLSALSAPSWAFPDFPEMDAGLATSAMALLGGGLALIAGRKRRG